MKHIVGTTLRVGACAVLAITGVALLAGKDDIRKFPPHAQHVSAYRAGEFTVSEQERES